MKPRTLQEAYAEVYNENESLKSLGAAAAAVGLAASPVGASPVEGTPNIQTREPAKTVRYQPQAETNAVEALRQKLTKFGKGSQLTDQSLEDALGSDLYNYIVDKTNTQSIPAAQGLVNYLLIATGNVKAIPPALRAKADSDPKRPRFTQDFIDAMNGPKN